VVDGGVARWHQAVKEDATIVQGKGQGAQATQLAHPETFGTRPHHPKARGNVTARVVDHEHTAVMTTGGVQDGDLQVLSRVLGHTLHQNTFFQPQPAQQAVDRLSLIGQFHLGVGLTQPGGEVERLAGAVAVGDQGGQFCGWLWEIDVAQQYTRGIALEDDRLSQASQPEASAFLDARNRCPSRGHLHGVPHEPV